MATIGKAKENIELVTLIFRLWILLASAGFSGILKMPACLLQDEEA